MFVINNIHLKHTHKQTMTVEQSDTTREPAYCICKLLKINILFEQHYRPKQYREMHFVVGTLSLEKLIKLINSSLIIAYHDISVHSNKVGRVIICISVRFLVMFANTSSSPV